MSLPEESVAANTLPEVTTIPTGKKLIFTDPDTNEGGIITLENLSKQILQNLTSQTFTLDQGNLTLLQALNQLNSKALIDTPTISTSVSDYIKTLSEGKIHYFRTTSNIAGNPHTSGSCVFIIYIIEKSVNGIGLSINHSSTAYYMRISMGKIYYIALS
ncbi:hypothetical protein DXA17_12575 [Ruminococcus sp. AM58-7XD]|jgi:hypothetical protein|nr:hypothetical protein DXA17_12575 [Ruminococcus sp. AM58-7XD]DAK05877.1 MAG TPA: hypothetical protein [Caudoviricetes sp.]